MEVDIDCTVEDLINKLEDELGEDNLYRLIYAGKLLKEEKLLTEYNISNKIPIIVMVTKVDTTASRDIEPNSPHKYTEVTEEEEVKALDISHYKRTRTITEDSGFEEELDFNYFVTDKEFTNVIEVIKTCEYLDNSDDPGVTEEEIQTMVTKYCEEEDLNSLEFENVILTRIEQIVKSNLNVRQMEALLEDVQSIFDEPRENIDNSKNYSFSLIDADFTSEESDTEEDSNIPEADNENPTDTQTLVTSIKSNPLSFLRDVEEFQFLRYLVLQDPSQLKPLLLSFGQSHPKIIKLINENKDIFVNMIHEQTGEKLSGRH